MTPVFANPLKVDRWPGRNDTPKSYEPKPEAGNGVSDLGDQLRGDLDAVQLAHVALDLVDRHAAGVHQDHLVVEPRQPPTVLLHQLRIEPTLTVPGN